MVTLSIPAIQPKKHQSLNAQQNLMTKPPSNDKTLLLISDIELIKSILNENLYRNRFDEKAEQNLRNFINVPFQNPGHPERGATALGGEYFLLWAHHGDRLCGLFNYLCSGPNGFSLFTKHHDTYKYPFGFTLTMTSHTEFNRVETDFQILQIACTKFGQNLIGSIESKTWFEDSMHFVAEEK